MLLDLLLSGDCDSVAMVLVGCSVCEGGERGLSGTSCKQRGTFLRETSHVIGTFWDQLPCAS